MLYQFNINDVKWWLSCSIFKKVNKCKWHLKAMADGKLFQLKKIEVGAKMFGLHLWYYIFIYIKPL